MKLHDLRPAAGSKTERTRVGRGIAAGKGKTAGRGTKGQKARAGGSIPPWFEGGQTPLHMRIPKLRGFKNRFKVVYEVVNVGAIAAAAERGAFQSEHTAGAKGSTAPATVNQDLLRAVGLVRSINKPLKILGTGELSTPLFVVADAFTASARQKIEAAGGTVNILEVPATPLAALGVEDGGKEPREPRQRRTAAGRAAQERDASARATRESDAAERAATASPAAAGTASRAEKSARADRAETAVTDAATEAGVTDTTEAARSDATTTSDEPVEAETPAGDDA